MRRSTRGWSAVLGVGLSLLVLVVVGCQNQEDDKRETSTVSEGKSERSSKRTDPDAVRLVSDWPKPLGALIVSGQMIGYLEPCGCSDKQKGGLVRREILEKMLEKQGWKLGQIDLGSLASEPGHQDRGGPDQAKIKYKTSLEALGTLGYDALALSVDDLHLGTAEVLMQYDNTLAEGPEALKVVAANATPVAGLGFEKRLRPSVRVKAGDVTIGVTAVLDPEAFEALNDPDKSALLTVKSPEETLPAVLADLEKDTKYQVLMVQGPPERAHALAKEFPGFELVVGTSPFPDPPAQPDVVNDGKTWVLNVGKKGMYVGVVGFFDDTKQPMRYQRIELNDRYDEYANLASEIKPLIGTDLQANLKAAGVLQSYPKRPYALFNAPPDATFVGADTCKACHAKTYAKWASTKHAHAYEVLVEDPHQPGRNREHDAACVSCHTTGFEYNGGFINTELTPNLKGNQCENCHGPGSKHSAEPDDEAFRKAMARTSTEFEKNFDYGCVRCHDGDNDPKFSFAEYYPKIEHKGLDSYIDPKVHKGIEAGSAAQ